MPFFKSTSPICFNNNVTYKNGLSWHKVLFCLYAIGSVLLLEAFETTPIYYESTSSSSEPYRCPKGLFGATCNCTTTVINCSSVGLWSLPDTDDMDLNIWSIDFSYNFLTSIDWNYFLPFTHLKSINLTGNKMDTITYSNDILPVTSLYIDDCDLTYFNFTSFCNVKILYASGNMLRFSDGSFICMKDLQEINLSNNKLISLSSNFFNHLDKLQVLNLAGNPWKCDCSLLGLRLFLQSLIASDGRLQDENNTFCSTNILSSPTKLMSLNTFEYSLCGRTLHSNRPIRSSNISFQWQNRCPQLKTVLNITCGPSKAGSCVYDFSNQSYSMVQYNSEIKSATSMSSCRNLCHENGANYFVHYDSLEPLCLCGDLNNKTDCADCSSATNASQKLCNDEYVNIPGATSIFYDFTIAFTPSQPEVMSKVNFHMSGGPSTYDNFTWNFSDGVTLVTSLKNVSHVYTYPDSFKVLVTLYSSKGNMKADVNVLVNVKSLSESGILACPSLVNAAEKLSISATFTSAWKQKVTWSKEDLLDNESKSGCVIGWTQFRQKCIQLKEHTTSMTSAHQDCVNQGGQLLQFNSELELDELKSVLQLANSNFKAFTGAVWSKDVNSFVWNISNTKAFVFKELLINRTEGDCVQLSSMGLSGTSCVQNISYVCEKGPTLCPGVLINKTCYVLVNQSSSWELAETACQTNFSHGHLATVTDETTNSFIASQAIIRPLWIGLKAGHLQGQFYWTNGQLFSGYSNLANRSVEEPCVSVNNSGLWRSQPCSVQNYFICQYDFQDQVKTKWYIAGTVPVFGNNVNFSSSVKDGSSMVSNTYSFILPGSWFIASGNILSWNFQTKSINSSANVALQIWRPVCYSKILTRPGCGSQSPLYSCQTNASLTCPDQNTCSGGQYYCLLTQTCKNLSEPCTCAGVWPVSTISCQNLAVNTNFTLITTVNITVPQYSTLSHFDMPPGVVGAIKDGDVIGFQTESQDFIRCDESASSPWQQLVMWQKTTGWKNANESIEGKKYQLRNNMTCWINAMYAKEDKVNLPENLSFLKAAGNYTFAFDTGVSKPLKCKVLALDAVDTFIWIHPRPASVNHSIVVVNVESGFTYFFVVKIMYGSDAISIWTSSGGETIPSTRNTSCPIAIANNITACKYNSSFLDAPYTIMQKKFSAGAVQTLQVSMINRISSKNLSVVVHPYTLITGLELHHSNCSDQARCVLEIGIAHTFFVSFKTGDVESITFLINGLRIDQPTMTQTSLVYTFNKTGQFIMTVNVSNPLSWKTSTLTVFASAWAKFTTISFIDIQGSYAMGDVINISARAPFSEGASVNITWKFGTEFFSSPVFSSELSTLYTFENPGVSTINLTLTDAFQDQISASVTVFIYKHIQRLELGPDSNVATNQSFNLSISIGNGMQEVGFFYGNITYTVDWGDGNEPQIWVKKQSFMLVSHVFNKSGTYSVNAIVYSDLEMYRVLNRSVDVVVQDSIAGLTLHYNGPKHVSEEIIFTINYTKGTYVLFSMEFGDGLNATVFQNSSIFPYTYSNASVYEAKVTARNLVSQVTQSLTLFAYDEHLLQIIKLSFPQCVPVNISINISTEVAAQSPSSLWYQWQLGNGDIANATGVQKTSTIYQQIGNYNVSLTVNNVTSSKAHSLSRTICVQEVISGLSVNFTNPIAFNQSLIYEIVPFVAIVMTGSNMTYSWDVDNSSNVGSGEVLNLNVTQPRNYSVALRVSNSISKENKTVNVQVIGIITGLYISCKQCSLNTYAKTATTISLTAGVLYGNLENYKWNIDNVTDFIHDRSIEYSFPTAGNYTVTVVSENAVSKQTKQVTIVAQVEISGVNMTATPLVGQVNQSILLQVSWMTGTDIAFDWACDSIKLNVRDSNAIHVFTVEGPHTCTVEVYNNISKVKQSLQLQTLSLITNLSLNHNLTKLQQSSVMYAAVGKLYDFTSFINTEYMVLFQWLLQLENYSANFDGKRFNYTFSNVSAGTITLMASNELSQKNVTLAVAIQEQIRNVSISSNINALLNTGSPTYVFVGATVMLHASMTSGSNFSLQWYQNKTLLNSTNDSSSSVTLNFFSTGLYTIEVHVSNAISSGKSLLELLALEPVTNVSISKAGATNFPYFRTGSNLNLTAPTVKGSQLVYNWSISSDLTGQVFTTNLSKLFYNLKQSGTFKIRLEVHNPLCSENDEIFVIVQGVVTQLNVSLKDRITPTGLNVILRAVVNLDSTNVSYTWNISGENKYGAIVNIIFYQPGMQHILLNAANNVSNMTVQDSIYALDPIENLTILDCDVPQQAQKLTPLKSSIDRGSNVSFTWNFGVQNNNLLHGQNVSYIFPFEGIYNMYLIAESPIDKKNVSCSKTLYYPIGEIVLKVSDPNPDYIFQNQNVTFKVTSAHLWLASFEWRIASPLLSSYTSVVNAYTTSFQSVGNFIISVNVSNGISHTFATLNFTVRECLCQLPRVMVIGDFSRTYKQSSLIELEVGVDTKSCILYLAQHKWTIHHSNDCSNVTEADQVKLGSTSTTSLKLILQPNTLAKGSYCVFFTTGYRYTTVSESASFKLNITTSGLKAIIKGGTSRTVALGSEVCMDGSLSFNPDNPADSTMLQYTWQCLESHGRTDCFPEKTVEMFCYENFQPGSYIIILQVEIEGHEPGKALQLVNVLTDSTVLPMVSIVCESCVRRGIFRVSASQTVALSAACEHCPCQPYFAWTVFEDQVKVTPSGSQSPTGLSGLTLLLTKWGVIKDHHNYTLVLDASCQKDFSKNGSATLELTFNLPPSSGYCTFTPTEIIPLENQVSVSCLDWVDVDDPDSSIIYNIYVDSQNMVTHQNRSYLLYTGTSKYQSVFLAAFADETVVLRVMVSDVYGASALGGSSSIQFISPILPLNMTVNDYLIVQTDTKLSALIKQGNAISIMQFSIALGYGLNRESKKEQEDYTGSITERLSEQRRAAIRDAIAISLSTSVPLSTLEDVQQMAYALRMLTDYSDEFVTEDSQLLIMMTLTRMQSILNQTMPAAQGQEDIPVDDIAAVISNLLKAVNMPVQSSTLSLDKNITIDSFSTNFRNLTPEISTAVSQMEFRKIGFGERHRKSIISAVVPFLEVVIVTSLQTTVIGGEKIKIDVNNITLQGQRCYAMNIETYNTAEHIQIYLGHDILSGQKQKQDEVLQIWINYRQNPYTYGYGDFSYDKMPVQTISFYETNGSYIKLIDLRESDSVKINMMSLSVAETSNLSSIDSSSHFDEAQTNLSYSAVDILPKKSKLWEIPYTISNLQKGVGVHIQLQIQFLPNDTSGTKVKGSSISCYLGLNYSPSSSLYTKKLVLTSEMMKTGTDHRLYTFFNNQLTSTDKLYVTATNNDSYHTVKLSVAIYYTFCQYFDTTNQQWSQDGCFAREESIVVNVSCQCNHLTSFGAAALISIVDLDFADLAALDLTTNPVVFIAVAIIFCAYLIIAIICRYFDRMDLKRISRIPLCGRDGEYRYKITVVTGRQFSSGTSANVGIKLFGSQGKGQTRHLTKTGAFQRNCHDSFLVAFDYNLGEVNKILVWHDNTGLSPSWFLSHIVVQDVQTKVKYTFIVHSWLSLEMKDGVIQKTVLVADDKQLKKFKQQFSTVFYSMLAEMHTWLSVSNRPDHSRFTRVQRATCCLTCTYLYMGINAVWYGVIKTKSEAEADLTWSSFGWEEIIIALVSTIMVLPLLYGLSTLFKRTRFKESVLTQARRPSTARTLEIDADIDMFSTSESCKTMASLGEWEIPEMERESTIDSLPTTSKLKRTAPILSRSNKVRNMDDVTHKKMKKELWSKDSIMQNWPDRMPDWIEHAKGHSDKSDNSLSGSDFSKKDLNVNKQQSTIKTVSNKNAALKRSKSTTDSDDDFDQQLNQLTAAIDKDENRKKENMLKKLSKKDITDDLFNSDDDWVHEEQEQVVKDSLKTSHIRGEPELAPNMVRKSSSNIIIKRTLSRDKCENSTFYKGKRQSMVSFSSKTKTFFAGRTRSRSSSLESQARPMKRMGCMLPPWCLYVTHAICFKLCLLSIILVLWYGYRFGASIALKWLASLGFSVFASILVVEPIKVILMTIIVKCSRNEFSDDDPSLLDITPAAETNEMFQDVKFKPLGGFALLHAKEEGKKNQHLYTMIRETVMFLTMFALFLSIVYINYNSRIGYYNNYNIQNKLYSKFDSSNSRMNLSNLKSIQHFWDWSQAVMARVIHLRELDQSENFGTLLGPAWLRQIRGDRVTCPVAWSGAQLSPKELDTKRCIDLSSLDPPTDPYGISWKTGTSNQTYYDSSALNMYSKFGYSLFYTGGGYTKILGSSYNETLATLEQLESENWIDHFTKAVFVEFILYSASTDLTSSGSILVEFSMTGGLLVSSTVQSEKLLRYVPGKVEPVLVSQVIFLLFVIYLTVILFTNLHGEKLRYFLRFWNWIDFVICLMAWTNSGLYLACTMKATDYIKKYLAVPSESATLAQVVLMHAVYRYLHALLVFLFCLKVVRQIRYIRPLYKFYMTLSVSSAPLMGTFFIFIILLLSYAQLGYLVFGTSFQVYSSFQQSLTALLALTFSKAVYLTQISQTFRVLSPIFFTSFCFIAYGLVMGMTISILSWSYKWSKSQLYYKTTLDMKDYEMIEFMIQKFKLITGMTKQKPPFRRVQFADRQSTSCPSTISSQESSQSLNKSSSHLFGQNWVNPLIGDPISNLHISWNKVLSLIEKVEEIDKYEDVTTQMLKRVIFTWKSAKYSKQKRQSNRLPGKGFESWQRLKNALNEKKTF